MGLETKDFTKLVEKKQKTKTSFENKLKHIAYFSEQFQLKLTISLYFRLRHSSSKKI